MQINETAMSSLGLGLLLSGLCVCSPPLGPDQQEAGPEKGGAGQQVQTDKAGNENVHTGSPRPHAGIVDAYRRCFDGCADQTTDKRATCHDDCATEVSAGSGDPTRSMCPRSCVRAFGSCLGPCGDNPLEGDVATCRTRCETLAQQCVDGCN